MAFPWTILEPFGLILKGQLSRILTVLEAKANGVRAEQFVYVGRERRGGGPREGRRGGGEHIIN